jgi:hypothetical protein
MMKGLAAWTRASITLLLMAALAGGAASASTVSIQLRRVQAPGVEPALKAAVVLTPEGATATAGAAAEAIRLPASAPGRIDVELESGTTWRVRAQAAGYWSPERIVLPVTGEHTAVDLPLFPAGRLKARVEGPQDGKRPTAIEVRFRPAPPAGAVSEAIPEDTVLCPLRTGPWDCEVPAGDLDLRLKGEGLIPVYRWGVRVAAGIAKDLGSLPLRRGSSVSGWITTVAGAAPGFDCRVELLPQSLSRPDSGAERDRLRVLTLEAHGNDRGFFQFQGVAPGSYVLRLAPTGYAPVRRAPIVVRAGLEAELIEPLVLALPVSFEVAVHPPVDPYGQRWRLELWGRDAPEERSGKSLRGTASPEGRWVQSGLAPGSYILAVLGDLDSRWVSQEVQVDGRQAPLDIDIPVVEVEGTVLLGGEPLAATLWFGGKNGSTRIRFDADAKGRFVGMLPRQGSWRVSLVAEAAKLKLSLKPIEVKVASGQRRARVEIKVPDTRLGGEVVDENGHKVAQAVVSTYDRDPSDVQTDDSGEFELRGLSAGTIGIEAEKDDATSGVTEVAIEERRENQRVHLVLRERTEARGRVVSATGPVPGAEVLGFPSLGEVGFGTVETAVTDVDGTFRLRLPAATRSLNLLVFPPGFAMRMLPAVVQKDSPIEVMVEPDGGTLTIELPGGGASQALPLLAHGGTWIPLGLMARWQRLQGSGRGTSGRMVLPNLEPGAYSLCVQASPELRHGQEPPQDGRCANGVLPPYGELSLRSPGPVVPGSSSP